MIIRNGIVDRVVRYNGWPVQIRNRYNNVGYIPQMTSNTTPTPFIASNSWSSTTAWYAFTAAQTYTGTPSPIGNVTAYVQITLDRPVSIWKFDWQIRVQYNIWAPPATVSLNATDDADNVLYTNNGIFINNNVYSGTVTLGSPTKRSSYFRLNLYPVNYVAGNTWGPSFYTFQIYPYD